MANIIESDEKLEVGSNLPVIPEGPATFDSLEAEAVALGEKFSFVTLHSADMIADAEEMLDGKAQDLKTFIEREYPVTAHHYDRLELLSEVLAPAKIEGQLANESGKFQTAEANAAIDELLENRRQLAKLGRAAGLPASLFSLDIGGNSRRLNVLVMRMEEVVTNAERFQARMPDKKKVAALIESTRDVVKKQKKARQQAKLLRTQRSLDTLRAEQYERLLLNILQYLSAQGQAAFDGDKSREARYALDHTYGKLGGVKKVEDGEAKTDVA